MIELTEQQGTPGWLAARARCFCASDAPAMMGVSPYKTRTELLREKSTGITPDHDAATLARFEAGHAAEGPARTIVENMIGDELYPIVATTDDGRLLASSDGATMLYDIGFEHKLMNAALAAKVREGVVPDSHAWQLDHQIAVFGFEKIIFVVSDGTPENFVSCEYRTTPDRQQRLMAGWAQFEKDVADYVPEPIAAPAPIGRTPETLPALRIEVTGMVTNSNLPAFREHAIAVLDGINTDLQTDADFANAESTVKWCKEVEDKLDAAKQHALSQTASIDELFRVIDDIKETARQKRLTLDKLVKSEKENRKAQIVSDARTEYGMHWAALCNRIGGEWIPPLGVGYFAEAIKGLKSLDSMRDKVATALANAKIDANAVADLIEANRKTVDDMTLVPDFSQVCTKSQDDFAAMLAMRKQQRAEAEARRLEAERERIRREEEALARDEALKKAAPEILRKIDEAEESGAIPPDIVSDVRKTTADLAAELAIDAAKSEDNGKTVSLGQINDRLSPIKINAAGLASLGFTPVGRQRAVVLFRESDISRICSALIQRLTEVSIHQRKAA